MWPAGDTVMKQAQDCDAFVYWLLLRYENNQKHKAVQK